LQHNLISANITHFMAESKKRKFFEVDENEEDAVKASNYGD